MAHFVNAKGTRISNTIVKGGLGQPLTVGVYGAAGLSVGPNDTTVAGITCLGPDKNQFTWYRLTPKKIANVMVEAKMGSAVWDYFQLAVGQPTYSGADAAYARSAPKADGRYTDNPNEVPVKRTSPAPGDVVAMLERNWAELTETGARTLTAQFMHETGEGRSCWNWNLGNVKCKKDETNVPHHYLKGTWEILSESAGNQLAAESQGLAYIATAEEAKKRGWTAAAGKVVAVFEPPHWIARFKSYASLEDGAKRWISHHRGVAGRFPTYIATLNTGDCVTVANLLHRAKYYTGSEGIYARSMESMKAKVDRALGPARS